MAKGPRGAEARLRKLLEFQAALARLARELGPATDLQIVLRAVLAAMRALMEFRGGTIQLVEGNDVFVAASDPPISEEVRRSRIRVGQGISGRVVRYGETIYVPDVDLDPRIDSGQRARGSNRPMKSYLATPLVVLGEVIGLLQVDSERPDAFDSDDRTILEGLAVQVAGAIESARRYEAIRELEQLRSDFIARVSHELRTPVAIASGFVETLMSEGDAFDERQRAHMLHRIQIAVTRLANLVERLLVVTSVEAGAVRPVPVVTELRPLLESVAAESSRPDAVQVSCPAGIHRIVDPKLLRQTLGLLVDNALSFAGDADIVADDIAIVVRDHGPGIPESIRAHVFEQFTRGPVTEPGMGMGLHLARTLASACHAELELLEPADGVGAAFRLSFFPAA